MKQRHFYYVLVAGVVGGLGSWFWSITYGTPLKLPIPLAASVCLFFGGLAALVGVYVLANSDVSNLPRLVAFSLLCGLFWKPVLDSGRTYVEQKQQVERAENDVRAALENLQGTPPGASEAAVRKAADATGRLLQLSGPLGDARLDASATEHTRTLVQLVEEKTLAAPESSAMASSALEQVKTAATESQNLKAASLAAGQIHAMQHVPSAPPH